MTPTAKEQRWRRVWYVPAIAALVCAATATPPAMAQNEERRIERAMRIADPSYRTKVDTTLGLTERSVLDVGGYVSVVGLNLRDRDGDYARLFQPEMTLYGRAVVDGAHTLFARARFQYRDYSKGDSFDDRGDRWTTPFLDRYWYEFDLAQMRRAETGEYSENNFNVRVGRQFVDWNSGLALSETLYAARPTLTFGRLSIEGIAGVTPPDRSITDFDASRDDFNSDTLRGFFGATLRYTATDTKQFYVYVLNMQDFNSSRRARATLPIKVDFDYEATYIGVGSNGSLSRNLLYDVEFVYQFGESMSDPLRGPQDEESISAWAARTVLTYLFGDPRNTRLQFEALVGSGDDDRIVSTDTVGGNAPGTSDHGFNSLGFANTGLAFAPALNNLLTLRLGALTTPFPDVSGLEQLQFGFDVLVHNKLDKDAPIDEVTTSDRYLGTETDFSINYRITSDFAITGRLGLFFPGDAIAGPKHTRQFAFIGCTLSF